MSQNFTVPPAPPPPPPCDAEPPPQAASRGTDAAAAVRPRKPRREKERRCSEVAFMMCPFGTVLRCAPLVRSCSSLRVEVGLDCLFGCVSVGWLRGSEGCVEVGQPGEPGQIVRKGS